MDTSTSPAGRAPRHWFADWLRIIALGLLILYHTGMAYVSWPWHVKSAHAGAGPEPWMWLLGPWRMSLLFVVSGLAAGWMTASARAPGAWLRGRARRLLLPLVTGMFLVVPPQAWLEVRAYHGYTGGYFEFMRLYLGGGDGGFCSATRGCLVLPTWNHLWFLPYLMLYSALLAVVLRWRPAWPERAGRACERLAGGAGLLLAPVAWLVATRVALRPLFPETHALVDDLFAHAQYAALFAFGVALARAPSPWRHFVAQRHLALALALAAWATLLLLPPGAWRALAWSTMQWTALVAALGYAHRHLNRDTPWRGVLAEAVFPVYLLHQTVTTVAVVALAPLRLGAGFEAALVALLTFGVSTAGYLGVHRSALLRPWFGLGPRSRAGYLVPKMRSPASPSPGKM